MNTDELIRFLEPIVEDPRHSWSVGTLGAIGEFHRAPEETTHRADSPGVLAIATDRGALKIAPRNDVEVIAYDNLSKDGETWSQALAVCVPFKAEAPQMVTALGRDGDAVQEGHREHLLYDLGAGLGLVRFCVRTADAALAQVLDEHAGKPLFGPGQVAVQDALLRSQPHRVVMSPIARIEVYQDIPAPDGDSPEGPHTHLLPQLLASQRTHSANTPLPEGLQSVLNLHPRSPWRDNLGRRTDFDPEADADFLALFARHALPDDARVRSEVKAAVESGANPAEFAWPETRRKRVQARLTLRRLAAGGRVSEVEAWRALYDRPGLEIGPRPDTVGVS